MLYTHPQYMTWLSNNNVLFDMHSYLEVCNVTATVHILPAKV